MRHTFGKPAVLVFVLLMVIAFPMSALADESQIAFPVGKKLYYINGQEKSMDAQTFVSQGRTYVPLRYLGEALGAQVKWISDGGSKGVIVLAKGKNGVVFRLDRQEYTIIKGGNQAFAARMDVSPISKDNRLYLPARYVAEVFGYGMNFDTAGNAVQINSSGNQTPVDIPELQTPEAVKLEPALVNHMLSAVLMLYSFMVY